MACVFPCSQGIVVGSGLAGVPAANTLLENGGSTVRIDKTSFCGGNPTNATSEISGAIVTDDEDDQGVDIPMTFHHGDVGPGEFPTERFVLTFKSTDSIALIKDCLRVKLECGCRLRLTSSGKVLEDGLLLGECSIKSWDDILITPMD